MIYKFGSIFYDRITANPFSSAHAGTLPKPSNYLRTRRVLLVMPRYLESTVFFGEWPAVWKTFNVTILEFFPIVLAIEIWGPLMPNKCIVFFSDNQAVVEIINRQTSKDRSIMVLLRHFVLCTLKYNILFHAKRFAGCINRESDALSRLQVEKFRVLAPSADPQPTLAPGGLLPNNWHIT